MRWKRLFFRRKKVNVQDVFNRVIDAGFYSKASDWMCLSLVDAIDGGFISASEYRQARGEIRAYLSYRHPTLEGALKANGLPSDFEFRLAIYRDWVNRPSLKESCKLL